MKKRLNWKGIWPLLKDTFEGLSENRITKLSASLAYFTIFSMGPLLVMIIWLTGVFLSREAIEGKVYAVLVDFVGSDTAAQLQEIIKSASVDNQGLIAGIIGLVTLLIGATSVFAEIQDSINIIWGLKPKPRKGWLKYLKNRFLSFSIIISLGFLLLVSLALSALVEAISNQLQNYFPEVTIVVFYIINLILTIGISTLIFATIFKVLPDAKIKWQDVFIGAVVTAILFLIGKFGISFYISKTKVGSTYGAAGSLVVLLVWVYYSSIILYLGAEFTKVYAIRYGSAIHPNDYAVSTQTIEIETQESTLKDEKTVIIEEPDKKQ
ncbi:MAG: YihY/virulence factor BrkB family protein [Bacteroidota bacterium]